MRLPSRSSGARALALTLSLAGLAACETPVPPPPSGDGGARDGGSRDAGRRDGAVADAHLDGDVADAGEPPDAPPTDGPGRDGGGGGDAGPTMGCRLDAPAVVLANDAIDTADRAVDVTYAGGAFWFVWPQAGPTIARVRAYRWPAVGDPTTLEVTPDTSRHRDAVVAPEGDGVIVGWIDNGGGGFQAYGRGVSAAGVVAPMTFPWTAELVTHDWLDLAPVGAAWLASWVESDGLGGASYVAVRPIGPGGSASVPMRSLASLSSGADRSAIAATDTGAVVAWTDLSDVYVAALGATGAPAGAAQVVSSEHNADGSVAVAPGLVAFGVRVAGARPEVRVRAVDADGVLTGPERIVTAPPETGIEPAVAPFAGGHLIAYRALPDGTLAAPTLRLAYAFSTAPPTPVFDVAVTTQGGGTPRIATAPDGRIAVAWGELGAEGLTLRAARIVCD